MNANRDLAYDFSLFEPQSKYTANVIKIPKRVIKRKRNNFKLLAMGATVTSLAVGSILIFFVHRQVILAETSRDISKLTQLLGEKESLNVQLKMQLEKLNYDNKTKNKPIATKIEYITLPQSDNSEIKKINSTSY